MCQILSGQEAIPFGFLEIGEITEGGPNGMATPTVPLLDLLRKAGVEDTMVTSKSRRKPWRFSEVGPRTFRWRANGS